MMRKHYTTASKDKVVQEIFKEKKTLVQLTDEYEIHRT